MGDWNHIPENVSVSIENILVSRVEFSQHVQATVVLRRRHSRAVEVAVAVVLSVAARFVNVLILARIPFASIVHCVYIDLKDLP